MSKIKNSDNKKLTMQVLNAAMQGDCDSMRLVLDNYEGYIKALATKKLYDEYGNVYLFIDGTLQRELELVLITSLVGFKRKKKQSA